jgi:hypothetical protein
MASLEGFANFTISLETSNSRPVPGPRIHNYEGPANQIDFDSWRRNDPRKHVIHWPLELAAIGHNFEIKVQDIRTRSGGVLSICITALTHHIPKKDAALRGIGHVIERWREKTKY